MEFLKQIAEQADKLEQARLYEGVEQTLDETFDAVVALIIESKDITEKELAEAACKTLMKDKQEEEEEAAVEPAGDEEEEDKVCPKCDKCPCVCKKMGKLGKSLKETLDGEYQAEVELLTKLSEDTLRAAYDKIAESFDSCVNDIMKNDKNLKKEGKNNTRRKAAEAIAASIYRKQLAKKGAK